MRSLDQPDTGAAGLDAATRGERPHAAAVSTVAGIAARTAALLLQKQVSARPSACGHGAPARADPEVRIVGPPQNQVHTIDCFVGRAPSRVHERRQSDADAARCFDDPHLQEGIHMKTSTSLTRLAAVGCLAAMTTIAAHAQSNVQIYGLLDLSVGRTQAPGGVATKGVDSGKMTTSHIGFRGREDLGGGLTAIFDLSHFVRVDTGAAGRNDADSFWSRSASVGLSGSFGTLSLGRQSTSLFVQTLTFNALGASLGLAPAMRHYFVNGTVSGDTGWSDSARYVSPRFGGMTFTLHGAAAEGNGGRNTGASMMYADGPLATGLAWQKVEKGAAVIDTTTWQLAGSYDFKAAKLFAQYGQVDNDTAKTGVDITGLGVAVPVGAGKVLLQWGRISPEVGAKRTTMSLGYDHNLSKRTDVYIMLMTDKISDRSTGNNISMGVQHRL